MKKALLVIDLQKNYFPGGKFPLWNTDVVLQNIEWAIGKAVARTSPTLSAPTGRTTGSSTP